MTARVRFLVSALVAAAFLWLNPSLPSSPALADDDPFALQADGGNLVTPADGGSAVVVDLGLHACYNLEMRCEGAQSSRFRVSTDAGFATAANTLLDYDRTYDIDVNCTGSSQINVNPKRYLSFVTDDAGAPQCKVSHSPF